MLAERINLLTSQQQKWKKEEKEDVNIHSSLIDRRAALLQASDSWQQKTRPKEDLILPDINSLRQSIKTKSNFDKANQAKAATPTSSICVGSNCDYFATIKLNKTSSPLLTIDNQGMHHFNERDMTHSLLLPSTIMNRAKGPTKKRLPARYAVSNSTMEQNTIMNEEHKSTSERDKCIVEENKCIIGSKVIVSNETIGSNKTSTNENPQPSPKCTLDLICQINENPSIKSEIKKCKELSLTKPILPIISSLTNIPHDFDIMKAGAAAVLKKPSTNSIFPTTILIRIEGDKNVRARLVKPHYEQINSHCVFLLLTPDRLFLFKGSKSNVPERTKATQMISDILANNELNCDVTKVDLAQEHPSSFWSLLGGVGSFENDKLGEDVVKNAFYEVCNDGTLKLICQNVQPKTSLLTRSSMIICDFGSEIYVWIGSENDKIYQNSALKQAEEIKLFEVGSNFKAPRPDWIILRKITAGLSDCLFNAKFVDFKGPSLPSDSPFSPFCGPQKAIKPKKPFLLPSNDRCPNESDVELAGRIGNNLKEYELVEHVLVLEETELNWNDKNLFTEDLKVCKLVGDNIHEIEDQKTPFIFEDNQCYVVHWKYRIQKDGIKRLSGKECNEKETGRQRSTYLYWIGKRCRKKEQGLCALALRKIDKERKAHVRIEQGQECPMFRSLFGGTLVIRSGKLDECDENSLNGSKSLFIIRGGPDTETLVSEQIDLSTKLHLQTCYIEVNGQHVTVLKSSLTPESLINDTIKISQHFGKFKPKVINIVDSQYSFRQPTHFTGAPRMFRIFDKDAEESHSFHAHPKQHLFTFEQKDLSDVNLVDQGTMLWVWSFTHITTFALHLAQSYWNGREGKVVVVHRGKEDESFKALFPWWNDFEEPDLALSSKIDLTTLLEERTKTRTLKDVQNRNLPQGSDLSKLENYLSDEDFSTIFKMSRPQFEALANWKKIELKKNASLF
uniref:HP domain-containing protein n=1 Tax=Rhabditophanes sp. KR3021 TaxID=114890 RepID=A0AC35TPB8_9BILA